MHPREHRSSRRQFLFASAGAAVALSGADALLRAADALGSSVGVPIGPGGIPLARRNHPVTLPLYSDNSSIAAGKNNEKGPLNVFNWSAYINPAVVKEFEKQYKVSVNITTFENEEEALAKLTSGQASFDVWFATVEYLSRAVAGKLIQPVNHSYLPNLKNVWDSLQSPFYDVHSRYIVPYMVYTTGIAWRKDKVKTPPTSFKNGYDAFWHAQAYSGRVAILDDQREAISMALLHRGVAQCEHGERGSRQGGFLGPRPADEDRQRQDQHDPVHRRADRSHVAWPGVVGRHGRGPELHAERRARQHDRLLAAVEGRRRRQ